MEDHAHAASSLASVPGFPPDSVGLRPFLLADAGPDMRQRFEQCCILRAQLAEDAQKSWLKEFREPIEPTAWPALLDGVNCRAALRNAQLRDPPLAAIVEQRRALLSAPSTVDMKPGMLKSKELEEYRLSPLDNVLERRMYLADARYWVPVMPDDSVPCLVPSISWRRWSFELSHLTFMNPRRTGGETFQIMRRLGY